MHVLTLIDWSKWFACARACAIDIGCAPHSLRRWRSKCSTNVASYTRTVMHTKTSQKWLCRRHNDWTATIVTLMATCTRSNTKLQQRTTRSLTGIRLLSVRIRTSVVYTTSLYSFHYSIQSLMITLSSCTVSNLTTVTAAVLQLFLDLF